MNWTIIVVVSMAIVRLDQLMAEVPAAMLSTPTPTPAPVVAHASGAQATTPAKRGRVARALITSGISKREPVDELNEVRADVPLVYLFTELRGMQGERITHRWEHNGQLASEVSFEVRGPQWRSWSSKTLSSGATGAWKVHVINRAGEIVATREFTCAR